MTGIARPNERPGARFPSLQTLSSLASQLELARSAARAAAVVLREEFARGSTVQSSAGKDIKLAADVLAEACILKALRAGSPHAVLSEESGADPGMDRSGLHWVVDPLDGTFNFSRRLPACAVSIGLCDGNRPVLGVVYDFLNDAMFSGAVGEGAVCNGVPIHVSGTADRASAMICTGFPSGGRYDDASLLGFVRKAQTYKKVRLLGSAALSLAYVAAGLVDVYHEEGIYLWDVAAGLALISAAGGTFEMRPTGDPWKLDVIATNGRIAPDLD